LLLTPVKLSVNIYMCLFDKTRRVLIQYIIGANEEVVL